MKRPEIEFEKRFNRPPQYLIVVPSRVNISGAMVDFHQGSVVTFGVGNLQMRVWVAPREDSKIRMFSQNLEKKDRPAVEFEGAEKRHLAQWAQYIQGGLVEYQKQLKGESGLKGFDFLVDSTIPIGAGLSSSSALTVAGVTALSLTNGFLNRQGEKDSNIPQIIQSIRNQDVYFNSYLDQIALTAGRAEWWYGTKGGLMDQFTICLAREDQAFYLDNRDLSYSFIDLPPEGSVVICNTNVLHNQLFSGFARRREESEIGLKALKRVYPKVKALRDVSQKQLAAQREKMPKISYRRCLHVVDEMARVREFAKVIAKGDLKTAGQIMDQTFQSLRGLYQTSCYELNLMHRVASQSPGCLGARITGGGFGGCILALVEKDKVKEFIPSVKRKYDRDQKIVSASVESEIWEAVSGRGLLIEELK